MTWFDLIAFVLSVVFVTPLILAGIVTLILIAFGYRIDTSE